MKQLAKGILVGSLATVAAIASGVLTTFHKTVIKPAEEEEEKFDQNRRAAIRKGRSSTPTLILFKIQKAVEAGRKLCFSSSLFY